MVGRETERVEKGGGQDIEAAAPDALLAQPDPRPYSSASDDERFTEQHEPHFPSPIRF